MDIPALARVTVVPLLVAVAAVPYPPLQRCGNEIVVIGISTPILSPRIAGCLDAPPTGRAAAG
ncbi:hypothetical protein GCM10027168_64730 [Streptomyces capparidis]